MNRKVFVASICKNEMQFIDRWLESAKDADGIFLLDTGSTDGTYEYALAAVERYPQLVVYQHVFNPWRFDVARNHLLNLLPDEDAWVINLDVDEVLVAGWRTHLDPVHADVTRPRYSYTWSWNEDGTPGLQYQGDKIHSRHGYEWRSPVHEALYPTGEEIQLPIGLEIHHHPDPSKSRGHYLPLLLLSIEEDPDNDRNVYYCARELYFAGEYNTAINLFKTHIDMPSAKWDPERAWSMRYLAKMIPAERELWLLRAVGTCKVRETWLDLAKFYHETEQWAGCYWAATNCVAIEHKPMVYLNEAEAWSATPYDLAALSAHYMGLPEAAVHYGCIAVELNPHDERLEKNLTFYTQAFTSFNSSKQTKKKPAKLIV